MQVEGNSVPIQRNPPVELLSTCTVLLGLILIRTLCSRGCLTLPTITNSPRVMAAVVINISARAFPPHVITQEIATAATARTSFASTAILLHSVGMINSITKIHKNKSATARGDAQNAKPTPATFPVSCRGSSKSAAASASRRHDVPSATSNPNDGAGYACDDWADHHRLRRLRRLRYPRRE